MSEPREEKPESRERENRTMSAVNVTNVSVLDNPSMFLNPFQFEIAYECLIPLSEGQFLKPKVLRQFLIEAALSMYLCSTPLLAQKCVDNKLDNRRFYCFPVSLKNLHV